MIIIVVTLNKTQVKKATKIYHMNIQGGSYLKQAILETPDLKQDSLSTLMAESVARGVLLGKY